MKLVEERKLSVRSGRAALDQGGQQGVVGGVVVGAQAHALGRLHQLPTQSIEIGGIDPEDPAGVASPIAVDIFDGQLRFANAVQAGQRGGGSHPHHRALLQFFMEFD